MNASPTHTRCPRCQALIDVQSPHLVRFRPFCSERCKMADLLSWFDGSYTLPTPLDDSEETLRAIEEFYDSKE